MKVAVAGATGLAGAQVHRELQSKGATVVPLARAHGVDLLAGVGLEALRGCDVLVDASNIMDDRMTREDATVDAATNLIDAAVANGVHRVVVLSILGVDDAGFDDFGYYRAKRAQERIALGSGLSTIVVRSSQWFEFALNPAAVAEVDGRLEVADWFVQPAAVASVGVELADAAWSDSAGIIELAGPEAMRLPCLTRRVLDARGDPRPVIAVPPRIAAFGSGALLADGRTALIGPRLEEWLAGGAP